MAGTADSSVFDLQAIEDLSVEASINCDGWVRRHSFTSVSPPQQAEPINLQSVEELITESAVADNDDRHVRKSLKRKCNSKSSLPPKIKIIAPKTLKIRKGSDPNSIFNRKSAQKQKSTSKRLYLASKLIGTTEIEKSAKVVENPFALRRQCEVEDNEKSNSNPSAQSNLGQISDEDKNNASDDSAVVLFVPSALGTDNSNLRSDGQQGISSCYCVINEDRNTALALERRCCQATDLIDNIIIPCDRPAMTNLKLHRASAQGVFKLLCSNHFHRLRMHQCCSICGIFCSHGKGTIMCCSGKVEREVRPYFNESSQKIEKRDVYHLFHKSCAVEKHRRGVFNGQNVIETICPHCGSEKGHYELNNQLTDLPSFHKPVKIWRNQTSVSAETVKEKILTKTEVLKRSILELVEQDFGDEFKEAEDKSMTVVITKKQSQTSLGRLLKTALDNLDLSKFIAVLRKGADPNQRYGRNGHTALILAIKSKNIRFVHTLINWSADPNLCDYSSVSPLKAAAFFGTYDIVGYLIAVGANQHHRDPVTGRTYLHYLVEHDEEEAIKENVFEVMYKSVLEVKDNEGMTALMLAAKHGKTKLVEILASLMSSSRKDLLNAEDEKLKTAMHWAAQEGFCEVVAKLVKYGALLNSQDSEGNTPLHITIQSKKTSDRMARILLMLGANPYIENEAGNTAIDMCQEEGLFDEHEVRVSNNLIEIMAEKKNNSKYLSDANPDDMRPAEPSRIIQGPNRVVCVDIDPGEELTFHFN